MPSQNLMRLQEAIAYHFKDEGLLHLALTHRSANKTHNERLEFLGDSVLGMLIAEQLFEQFPKQPEGKLTRMRASLVNRVTLAKIAKEIALGDYIKLGAGELKSGGHRRESILSDTLEAIIGAVYLDAGFDAAKQLIAQLFAARLAKLDPAIQIKDSKTQLQEYLQSRQYALPDYQVVDISGKDHAQIFTVSCTLQELKLSATAKGSSRRVAEQKAAQQVLESINHV